MTEGLKLSNGKKKVFLKIGASKTEVRTGVPGKFTCIKSWNFPYQENYSVFTPMILLTIRPFT